MPRTRMTKEEFKRKFAELRNRPYKSRVKGTGGAGNTLEHLLGLGIDNRQKADLGFAELKVRMRGATSSVKLFTMDRDAWQMSQSEATQKFGTTADDGRKRLYFEMRQGTITITKLKLFGDKESISILSPRKDVIAEWSLDDLVETFTNKIRRLVVVTAETSIGRDGDVRHIYRSALYLYGFTKAKIRRAFLNNKITLNLHIESIGLREDGSWRVKNRGTAFRINEDDLEELFENCEYL